MHLSGTKTTTHALSPFVCGALSMHVKCVWWWTAVRGGSHFVTLFARQVGRQKGPLRSTRCITLSALCSFLASAVVANLISAACVHIASCQRQKRNPRAPHLPTHTILPSPVANEQRVSWVQGDALGARVLSPSRGTWGQQATPWV